MDREVFQSNIFIAVAIILAVWIGVSYVFVSSDFPVWGLLAAFAIGVFVIFSMWKTKLVVDGEMLRYEKVFGGEEVNLNQVFHIVSREIETYVDEDGHPIQNTGGGMTIEKKGFNVTVGGNQGGERKVERVIYIMDEAGRTHFSIPANTIRFKDKTRFREAVRAVNPNIEVF